MEDLILFPCGGNAREALAAIASVNRLSPKWNILGFVDDDPKKLNTEELGYGIIGNKNLLGKYPKAKVLAVPGSPDNFIKRKEVIDSLNLSLERFATIIHPRTEIGEHVTVGYNTLVMAGVVATVNVAVGNHCIVRPNTTLSHDVVIEDYCIVGSNVSLSGTVILKENCYIGAGVQVRQNVCVSQGTLVGIGAVVLKDTPAHSVMVGNPARLLRGLKV